MALQLRKKTLHWPWVIAFLVLSIGRAWGSSDKECIRCHRIGSQESTLQIDLELYGTSVHSGVIACTDCHKGFAENNHPAMTEYQKVNCQQCHKKTTMHSKRTIISCASCHTTHEIHPSEDSRSSVNFVNLPNTCGACHSSETASRTWLSFLTSFRISSHHKGNFAKRFDKRMCVGCHQGKAAHGEDGPINTQECYKCHLILADEKAKLGYFHPDANWRTQPVSVIAWYISATLLACVCLLLFGFLVKFVVNRRQGK